MRNLWLEGLVLLMGAKTKTALTYAGIAALLGFLSYLISAATVSSYGSAITDWKAWLVNTLIGAGVAAAIAAVKWLQTLLPTPEPPKA